MHMANFENAGINGGFFKLHQPVSTKTGSATHGNKPHSGKYLGYGRPSGRPFFFFVAPPCSKIRFAIKSAIAASTLWKNRAGPHKFKPPE